MSHGIQMQLHSLTSVQWAQHLLVYSSIEIIQFMLLIERKVSFKFGKIPLLIQQKQLMVVG